MANQGSTRAEFKITRGATILLFLSIGLSLLYLLSPAGTRAVMLSWLGASAATGFDHGRVWTFATAPLLETQVFSLIFQAVLLWMFIPTLENWWGTKRFALFAIATAIAGTLGPALLGLVGVLPREAQVLGLDPFIHASVVAYGIIFARQPVRFFGALPMTGRQLMWGILGLAALFIALNQAWSDGVAYVCAIGVAVLLTRANPLETLRQWRRRRAKRRFGSVPKPASKDEATRWN